MRRILYPLSLPSMPECDGCGRCCGPVGVGWEEKEAIDEYCAAHDIVWVDRGVLECGYLDEENRCRIYEVRPLICRMYGVTVDLPCPLHPEVARLSFSREEVHQIIGGKGYAVLGPVGSTVADSGLRARRWP